MVTTVATLRIRQLEKDIDMREQEELRRLEGGATGGGEDHCDEASEMVGGDGGSGERRLDAVQQQVGEAGEAGVVVVGAKQRAELWSSESESESDFSSVSTFAL